MTEMDELAEWARARVDPALWDYLAATAPGARAGEGWSSADLRPRVLVDTAHVDPGTTVLGTRLRTPVLAAPAAMQARLHPDGEAATARAVRGAGSLVGVSSLAGVPFAAVEETGAPWWFQVYVVREWWATEALVRRAAAAGARALVLTADTIALPDGVDPGPGSTWANLTAAERARAGAAGLTESFGVGLDVIGRLRDVSGGLPVVVKGVLRADDALRCLDAGAAGIVVSSHGGRRLGPTVPVARALTEVAAAVGDAGEVYADSGLRSGRDVLVALALGARAVFLGRPVLWGLAAEGESGVGGVLGRVTAELVDAMRRVGAADLAAVTRDLVVLD